MNFNDLSNEQKEQLHNDLMENAVSVGGINPFLQMIEDIRTSKPKALLNKTAIFHYKTGKINWGKSIFKDTLAILYSAMAKEEKDGDIIAGLKPKEYKNTMNMMRALKPVVVEIIPKDETCKGFTFSMLDATQEKKTKVDLMFKIIFFFNIEFAKKVLSHEIKAD
ncbi:MAG: hypothetical protein KAQ94_05730 [Arcobacteraceae bacterium]|nr:hypothetical protein [Arcobacteraceae bacterium]